MYSKVNTLTIKSSASLLCNNLASLHESERTKGKVCIVHKALAWILTPTKSEGGSNCQEVSCRGEGAMSSNSILQVKWCCFPERVVLVIAAVKGIQMFDEDGQVMLFWQSLSTNQSNEDNDQNNFAKGIAPVSNRYVCVGTAIGEIMVFDVPMKGTAVRLQESLKSGHSCSLSDLVSQGDKLISADDNGDISVWQSGETFQLLHTMKGYGYPCSSLALWNDYVVVAAYGTGHIRMFDCKSKALLAEICAHSRWINAIDISLDNNLLLSVSEDSCIRMWRVSANPFQVEMVYDDHINSLQLCGAKFLNSEGTAFAVSGYDSQDIYIYNSIR